MFSAATGAQDLPGNWQGTMHTGKDQRIVVNIRAGEKDGWSAKMYSIDQGAQPVNVVLLTKQDSNIKIAIDTIGSAFEGKLSWDGKTIAGTWTEGSTPVPMVLVKATGETAWDIPSSPVPSRLPVDAEPSFDAAIIKLSASGATSVPRPTTTNGHDFTIRNGSLAELISFAFDVDMKQITHGPNWMNVDRYDIDARQDGEGQPSDKQLRSMTRKLLEDRFKLKVRYGKRDLPAFVLTVGKSGQRLRPTQAKGTSPGMGFKPMPGGVLVRVNNGTVADFASFLQSTVLDRPVVDHSGLAGKFDISVSFVPDKTQFKGHPPTVPPEPDMTETCPGLFEAMEQQLGLKLAAERAQLDVIAIDHVEKPSAK
jgi:uncharacterized protein (TIGR03435 family)